MYKLIQTLVLMGVIFPTWAQDYQKPGYKIYHSPTEQTLELSDIISLSDQADVILFGEEHNDSLAHALQRQLYEDLLTTRRKVILSMEMFERDVQLVLNEYLAGLISESSLIKEGKAWNNYADYAPLVNLAKKNNQQVIAANVPARYASMVSRKGIGTLKLLEKKASSYFSIFEPPGENDPYRKKFDAAMGGHGHHMGPSVFHAQLLRDATMAESILKAWKKNRNSIILHLTGRFHSDGGLGTVSELSSRKKKLRLLTLSCFPAEDFADPDWSAYEKLADIIILTDSSSPKSF
ncbi:ChaN family lipoprotein [Cyclobacterium roseum]|uniref:ChaN family lipoprotein n=1 Tax=Cyclobacterium roseum TaxID=2666137 RepID=UPI001391D22D|nr:ChaN family lipoprotein [Cyclobacterium roseum]